MPSTSKRRKAINHKAKEVTDLSVLQDMKDKAQAEVETIELVIPKSDEVVEEQTD